MDNVLTMLFVGQVLIGGLLCFVWLRLRDVRRNALRLEYIQGQLMLVSEGDITCINHRAHGGAQTMPETNDAFDLDLEAAQDAVLAEINPDYLDPRSWMGEDAYLLDDAPPDPHNAATSKRIDDAV